MSVKPKSSGTSTLGNLTPSSSAQPTPAEAVAAQAVADSAQPTKRVEGETFFGKWGLISTLGGIILAGVIGFFASIYLLKDEINSNKTEISVIKKDIANFDKDLQRIEGGVKLIPELQTDMAILKTKQESISEAINKKDVPPK